MTTLEKRLEEYRPVFEEIYDSCNKRELVHPDPLEFLYHYSDIKDREIAGFIASSLSYGRVAQIIKSVTRALKPLGENPGTSIQEFSDEFLFSAYRDFRHRFTTGREMAGLVIGLRETARIYGSLEGALDANIKETKVFLSGLDKTISIVADLGGTPKSSLLARPSGKSACKRLFLYFKWMVRVDDVDPGGWNVISPAQLIMPVDTHIHNISLKLSLTDRKQADLKTALEITKAFAFLSPEDPLKYDFALTRFGIRNDMKMDDLIVKCCRGELPVQLQI